MTLIKSISGIRGTIGGVPGENLTAIDVARFSSAFGAWLITSEPLSSAIRPAVVLGRDARPSGKAVSQIVANTLNLMGIDIIDLGITTTPTVEMAVVSESAGGGIIVTASHNPVEWNALKLLNHQGEFISEENGRQVLQIAEAQNLDFASVENLGSYRKLDFLDDHIRKILELKLVDRSSIAEANFKIAVDAVNSSGGIAVPKLLTALGVRDTSIIRLHCDPTGLFPHNPEPLPEHLTELSKGVLEQKCDLGIAVDPDVDRLAFVQEEGQIFGEEFTLVAVADYVLSSVKGNTVSNMSSTQALQIITQRHGGDYFASAVGEVNVVETMKSVDAVIGGEGNGGVIYPDLHYGRDALVGIALFLSQLARFDGKASALRASYPDLHISKNKVELTADIDIDQILMELMDRYKGSELDTRDGVKVTFDHQGEDGFREWVHLRKSNTEPIVRVYAEARSKKQAAKLADRLISDLKELSKAEIHTKT